MESIDHALRFLVKGGALSGTLRFELGASKAAIALKAEPLFKSIGVRNDFSAAAFSPTWHLVTAKAGEGEINPWDVCHALLSDGGGLAARGIEFIEPDLLQRWQTDLQNKPQSSFELAEGARQNKDYPRLDDNFWFRDGQHGQFDAALHGLGDPGAGKRIRVAHFDTGYDPNHKTLPAHLSKSEQRNFVDEDFPEDATDRSSGLLNNLSHGTGTLSILAGTSVTAGKSLGGAPYSEVILVRVANRVVLFRNSAIARAFDYVHGLCGADKTRVHVITMSMGGLPSQAWAEAINALYDAGVFIVAAAGNNYANLPSRLIVYPARFNRVVAACGVMADGQPYADLRPALMAGDYGPDEKMTTAIAAYTPNTPWAHFGKPKVVDFDGAGTSAATPQVAAAAALWIQKHRPAYNAYPEPWMRVEAVRRALFDNAAVDASLKQYFGSGKLRAKDALDAAPAGAAHLRRQPLDDTGFPLVNVLFGLGAGGSPVRNAMIELEARQILQAKGLEINLPAAVSPGGRADLVDQLLATQSLSQALREALGDRKIPPSRRPAPAAGKGSQVMEELFLRMALQRKPPAPSKRRLRIFAYDPSLATDAKFHGINEAIVKIPWEDELKPGPIGEYLEVVDVDPASKCCYAPVDLNNPHILAESGLQPSEANPQFHQQMVYAVAMRTIEQFERALGRKSLWAPRIIRDSNYQVVQKEYVQRLRIYPHALREENAYYTSQKMALLFGYFSGQSENIGTTLPGARVFCAVSHDIIAHETAHALLDGLHPRYQEATNPEVLAFHEAFADIVALFQHFTMPESLLQQVKDSRGDMQKDNPLAKLAVQFGEASGMHGALRSYIGHANAKDYDSALEKGEPHELGAVLVSAVFAAFNTIYRARSSDLVRLATNGTGILPEGEISHDLAGRLTDEAAKVADQVLNMCIRALDYCPPVDINFGDYLRAIITADRDLVPEDSRGYRVAFIAAFRERGIFPRFVAHLAEDSLVWETPPFDLKADEDLLQRFKEMVDGLDLQWSLNTMREHAYENSWKNAKKVHKWLVAPEQKKLYLDIMGFEPKCDTPPPLEGTNGQITGVMRAIEVQSVRPLRRTSPDGTVQSTLVIEITQTFRSHPDQERYRGGCTLLVDLGKNEPRYLIRKRIRGVAGAKAQQEIRVKAVERSAEWRMRYYAPGDPGGNPEPFALLHRHLSRG